MSMIGIGDKHTDPHIVKELCWCNCENCTTRTSHQCICIDCICETDDDHIGVPSPDDFAEQDIR